MTRGRRRRPNGLKREVEEGLLLLEHAIRMRLRNRIVVDTLTSDGAVDVDAWRGAARGALEQSRLEADASYRRITRKVIVVRDLLGEGDHQHDYRADDVGNLQRRRRIHRALVRRLAAWERSPRRVDALLLAARRDAWEEIDAEIRQLAAHDPAASADEGLLRSRLDLIGAVDLPALARSRREAAQAGE